MTSFLQNVRLACIVTGAFLALTVLSQVANAGKKQEPVQVTVCRVFATHCYEALTVAICESRLNVNAQNGQYLGLFQMGSSERHRYGHGDTAEEQAKAARRYFVASGHDWSPWQCKP